MNRKEFDELRKEFAEYVYRYEYFQKCGSINDSYYTLFFQDVLRKIQAMQIENIVLDQAISKKARGESINDLDAYLEKCRVQYNKDLDLFEKKIKKAEEVTKHNDNMTTEDKKQFEKDWLDFCMNLHPVVKVYSNEKEHNAFMILRGFYFENNYDAFKEFLSVHKDGFTAVEYKEEDFNKINGYYFENQNRINADFNKKSKQYPYTKTDVLKDEISIAREKGDLHVDLTNMQRQNKELKEKFQAAFNKEFNLGN